MNCKIQGWSWPKFWSLSAWSLLLLWPLRCLNKNGSFETPWWYLCSSWTFRLLVLQVRNGSAIFRAVLRRLSCIWPWFWMFPICGTISGLRCFVGFQVEVLIGFQRLWRHRWCYLDGGSTILHDSVSAWLCFSVCHGNTGATYLSKRICNTVLISPTWIRTDLSNCINLLWFDNSVRICAHLAQHG
jgi:hypothetical protein